MHWVPHEEQGHPALAGHPRQAVQILAKVGAFQGFETLRREMQFIAERQADPPAAEVERQDSAVNAAMHDADFIIGRGVLE